MRDSDHPLGLRERKRLQTRAKIIDAALTLFFERGFEETTIDDIVAAADIARRTFFHYFSSKEDVIVENAPLGERLVELVAGRPESESPAQAAKNGFCALVAEQFDARGSHSLAWARLITDKSALQDRMARIRLDWAQCIAIGVGRRMGIAATDIAPQIIGNITVWTVHASLRRWVAEDGKRSRTALIEEAFALLHRSLNEPEAASTASAR